MKLNEILGIKIIDKNAYDVGKLSDLKFNTKTFEIEEIYATIGNPISKKYYPVVAKSIIALGDYLQISENKETLEENVIEKIKESEDKDIIQISMFKDKKILDASGNEVGKVTDINIDIDELKVNDLTLSKGASFGKSSKSYTIQSEDISGIGDYIILNKSIDDIEKVEDEDEKESEEKTKVNID